MRSEAPSPVSNAVEREYVSCLKAKRISNISDWTWRRWAYSGKIASNKVSTRLLIPLSEVRRVMEEGSRPRVKQPAKRTEAPALATALHG